MFTSICLQRHNPVTVTLFRVLPFHACGHEGAAELLHAYACERARLTLAQQGDELGKGDGQGLFVRTGGTEVAGKKPFPLERTRLLYTNPSPPERLLIRMSDSS